MKKILLFTLLALSSLNFANSDDNCAICSMKLAFNDKQQNQGEAKPQPREKIPEISREELKKLVDDQEFEKKDILILNVLGQRFYDDAHIPHSISAPLKELEERSKEWKKDQKIIVYCACIECDASYKAYKKLVELGFKNVRAFEGGIRDWFQTYGKEGTNGPCSYPFLKEKKETPQQDAQSKLAMKKRSKSIH